MTSALQAHAITVALQDMMRRGRFDICTIRKILEITGSVPTREDWATCELLHCVDFKDFPPGLRLEFPRLLERVLNAPAMKLTIRYEAPAPCPRLADIPIAEA